LLAPLASVKPVGADPNFEMLPNALVASVVPVPEVVPPALSMVSEIELSTVPVTVSVPLEVAADVYVENAARANRIIKNDCRCIFGLLNLGRFVLRLKGSSALRRQDFRCHPSNANSWRFSLQARPFVFWLRSAVLPLPWVCFFIADSKAREWTPKVVE
jgi:hypothetical protein